MALIISVEIVLLITSHMASSTCKEVEVMDIEFLTVKMLITTNNITMEGEK